MPRLSFILTLTTLFTASVHLAGQSVEHHLAFSLMPNWGGGLISYAEVSVSNGKILDVTFISKQDFVLRGSGCQKSKANPDKVNLFELNGIFSCGCRTEDEGFIYSSSCDATDRLWKLRYASNPTSREAESGWAEYPTGPGESQKAMLAEFGVYHLNDFIWGPNCFALLQSVGDPSWVSQYD